MLLYTNSECKKHTFEAADAAAKTMDGNKRCKYVTTKKFAQFIYFKGFLLSQLVYAWATLNAIR